MIAAAEIAARLGALGVARDDLLFVHSGLATAMRIAGRGPEEKMATIVDGLVRSVPDGILGMPTFTYSSTKGEVFDPGATASEVGALTEYFRNRESVRRTLEPNFSCALSGHLEPGWAERLFTVGDTDAFGNDGIFGMLREGAAKLLFLGVSFECCTYVHHVEQRLAVPYRYFKEFAGAVRVKEREEPVVSRYFVRRADEDVVTCFGPLADELVARGRASAATLPRGPRLFLTDTRAVEEVATDLVAVEPDFLLRRGHPAPAG